MNDRWPVAKQRLICSQTGRPIVGPGQSRHFAGLPMTSGLHSIVLQNSKVAAVQIFGENLKGKEVDNSHSFSRATEVAHEFGARRRGPSDHYTKNAPAAPRISDPSCKTTFATQSTRKRTSSRPVSMRRTLASFGEPEACCSSSRDVLAGAAIHAKTKLDDCLQRRSTAYLIGGAYWMPPLLQSEFSPRGIFSFNSTPTLRS